MLIEPSEATEESDPFDVFRAAAAPPLFLLRSLKLILSEASLPDVLEVRTTPGALDG